MEYIEKRKDYNYYKKCNELIERLAMDNKAKSIIDIGGYNGFFVKNTPIEKKTCLDIRDIKPLKNINFINEDFLTWKVKEKYDVAICMQVLEHLDNTTIQNFTDKLFTLSNHVIISVPYKWRKGWCKYHKQDPVDHSKLKKWTKKRPNESFIIKDDGAERLIAYYNQS